MKKLICVVFVLILLSALPAFAGTVTLDYTDVRLTSALEGLFRSQGINYALVGPITGSCNVHVANVTFEEALKAICKSGGLVYRADKGVYIIEMKPATPPVSPDPPKDSDPIVVLPETKIEKIPLTYANPWEILSVLQGSAGNTQSQYGQPYGMQGRPGQLGRYGSGQFQPTPPAGINFMQPTPWQTPRPPYPASNPTPAPTQAPVQNPPTPATPPQGTNPGS